MLSSPFFGHTQGIMTEAGFLRMGGGGCSLKETSPGQTGTRADTAPPGGDCPRLHRCSCVGGGGGGGRQRSLIRFMGGRHCGRGKGGLRAGRAPTSPSTAGICCPGARTRGPCEPPGPRGLRRFPGNWEEGSRRPCCVEMQTLGVSPGQAGAATGPTRGSHLPTRRPPSPPEGGVLTHGLNEPFVWTLHHDESDPRIRRRADLFRQNLQSGRGQSAGRAVPAQQHIKGPSSQPS